MHAFITALVIGALLVTLPVPAAQANGLVNTISRDLGQSRPKGCPGKWCACYLNRALEKAGYAPLGSNRARDFAGYGRSAKAGQVGAIMVMKSHVGVVAGRCGDGRIKLLSGNHSHRVGSGCYPASRAIAWRAPVKATRAAQATAPRQAIRQATAAKSKRQTVKTRTRRGAGPAPAAVAASLASN